MPLLYYNLHQYHNGDEWTCYGKISGNGGYNSGIYTLIVVSWGFHSDNHSWLCLSHSEWHVYQLLYSLWLPATNCHQTSTVKKWGRFGDFPQSPVDFLGEKTNTNPKDGSFRCPLAKIYSSKPQKTPSFWANFIKHTSLQKNPTGNCWIPLPCLPIVHGFMVSFAGVDMD